MTTGGAGSWICRRWIATYTRRLPDQIAEQRRDEIISDLWEHHQDSALAGRHKLRHNLDVIERVLSGIPADLSWRRGIQRSRPRPDTGDPMTTEHELPRSTLALIIVAGLGMIAPFPFLALLGTGLKTAEILWVLGSIALAAVLAAGLVLRLRGRNPVVSTVLLLVGAFAPTTAWFWMPPVYLLTLAIITITLLTARSRPTAEPVVNPTTT